MATRALSRNWPYINQQLGALLVNTSPTVKIICIVTLLGYTLSSFSETAIQVLSVTPGYLLPPSFCIWSESLLRITFVYTNSSLVFFLEIIMK